MAVRDRTSHDQQEEVTRMNTSTKRLLRSLGVTLLLLPASPAPAGIAAGAVAEANAITSGHEAGLPAPAPRFIAGKRAEADDVRILVLEEGSSPSELRYYDQALENLGLPRTLVHSWNNFETLLTTEGPWDLVIANSYGNNNSQAVRSALLAYLTAGGRLIYTHWAVFNYADDPLLPAMGVVFQSSFSEPIQFSPTAGNASHPIFTIPNQTGNFVPTEDQATIDGQIVTVTGGAVALATFAGQPGSGAIVWGPQRRSIFNAFQATNFGADTNQDGTPDIVALLENQISLIPLVVTPELEEPPVAGQNARLTAQMLNGPGATLQIVYRQKGQGDADYLTVAMSTADGINYNGIVPAARMSPRGLEYYITAARHGATTTFPTLEASTRPLATRTALANFRGPALPDARYRLIGFPFDVDPASPAEVFVDDLGEPDNRRWRVSRFISAVESVVEFPGFGNVRRGHGYWAIARGGVAVGASGLSALPDTTVAGIDYAILRLAPGWNQIATPFAFPIHWDDRIDDPAGGIEDAAWDFVGGDPLYQTAAVLQPFFGYWVFNTAEQDRLLLLPFLEATTSARTTTPLARAGWEALWQLGLELTAGEVSDRSCVIGAAPTAREGRDALDLGRPPAPPAHYVSLASLLAVGQPAGHDQEHELARDFRPAAREGWRFRLRARGDVEAPAMLSLGPASNLPAHFAVALIDPATGRSFDLLAAAPLVLPRLLTGDGDEFELLVGEPGWVWSDGRAPEAVTTAVTLAPNHPNPFNPQTTITFALPVPGRVSLQIFDVAGRHVTTLLDGVLPNGPHAIIWDGRDSAGRSAASGTYHYRLVAGGTVQSRSMVLLK
jgi:hypothetical protein